MMLPKARNWVLAGSAALIVGVLALHIVWPQPGQDEAYWPWALGLMAFPVAAALILSKRPGNGVGRTMGVIALASLANFGCWWYVANYPDTPLTLWADLVSVLSVLIQFGGMVFLLHVFPTGRPFNRMHKHVLLGFVSLAALGLILTLLSPGQLPTTKQPNPAGVLPDGAGSIAADLWDNGLAIFSVVGVVFLVFRWRRAHVVERAQLRWFLAAAVMAVIALSLSDAGEEVVLPKYVELGIGLLLAAALFWSLPAAIVIAVTRYRLYEIDRLLSRTVSYALVVGFLAVVYAGIAIGLPQVLDSSLSVAAATLVAAAMFNPLRRRVQRLVDRRFNRVRYDAKQQMDRLAGRLRTELDLGEITDEILDVVSTTMQPATASVWIREARE